MKKILTAIILSLTVCIISLPDVKALDNGTYTYIEETFDDGSYIEITIVNEASITRSTITKKKTASFKDEDGKVLWSVAVTGTFTYNGTTSTCTSSSVSTANYSSSWKLSNAKASKSGNTATASVTAKQYHSNGTTVLRTINKTVNLTCDKNGNLS